jgi:uncharacterized membrane protein YedE/YeeE
MLDAIKQPWPWYIAGPIIGLAVPVLLLLGNRSFGISSSLRHICAACIPANIPFFQYDWRKESWNLFFVGGILIGALIAGNFLSTGAPVAINESTRIHLEAQGVHDFAGLMPRDVFDWSQLFTLRGFVFMVLGGFMIGFGTRYAGGCTSGHAIMGISNLQWTSLLCTCCFMGAGILMTWFVIPSLLHL